MLEEEEVQDVVGLHFFSYGCKDHLRQVAWSGSERALILV